MKKFFKLFLFLITFACSIAPNAIAKQSITFDESQAAWKYSDDGIFKIRIRSIVVGDAYANSYYSGMNTYWEIKVLKKARKIRIECSKNVYISSNNGFRLVNDAYYNLSDYACLSWEFTSCNPGDIHYINIPFIGAVPPGLEEFEIRGGNGLFSRDFELGSDDVIKRISYISLSESQIKQNINNNNDGICGIYESLEGSSKEKIACVKLNGEYQLIAFGSSNLYKWWKFGDIRAWITQTPSGIFRAKWRMSDKSVNEDCYITFDGYSMTATFPSYKTEKKYLKLYPTNSPTIGAQGGGGNNSNGSEWTGTGFALKNGYIVTNHHVVDGAKSIVVLGVNGNTSTEYKAKVVGVDKNNDLALIKIDDYRFSNFNNVPYAIPNTTREVGSDVFVLGYPLTTYMGEEIKLTNGIISSKTGYQGDVSTYQISAPVQPGNSGGPLFDNKGNIIGIVNAGIPGADNVGYAIKTSYLYNLIQSVANTNIIPQTNTITGTSLADKVKQVKNCVFFIKCKGN